ncbi:hypothetical protein MLD38_033188 [Melastoma candidum]|uniref:Uncharacterized protein n=1 Tax=Melastoma candidum TaxID=119954 RepID=A0ACB9M6I4_9MYRT|nr:hypothetical protein MLD38_033188 [Melastoma candidum]
MGGAFWVLMLVLCSGFRSKFDLAVALLPDEATLMAIGKELGVPGWGVNGSFCTWPGIRCDGENSAVEELDLSHLFLRGEVDLVSELAALKRLDLSGNSFRGLIPPALGNLSELEFLDMSMNKFFGYIPKELGSLRNLRALNLSNNLLIGEIPDELGSLEKLEEFQVSSNGLNGSIPLWLGNLSKLAVFAAYENNLVGEIPENLGNSSELWSLNLHSNWLDGKIPESLFAMGKLEVLILTQNRLTGAIPDEIGSCKSLSSIRIGNNNLDGVIPRAIGNASSLTYFEADNNNLSGEIVPEFARCSNLTLLNLASNGFIGRVPAELGNLVNLQELILSGNNLYGEMPSSILGCKNLNKLDISNNRFNGTIPAVICNISRLQYLVLGQNLIKGEIPRDIGNCAKLLELHLGSNYLTGSIPREIGRLRNLQISLNLSFNHLHGSLPSELGKLDKLVSIDVSNNQLSGLIPPEFRGMMSLIEVNFSNNLLTGPIPESVPFQKSPNSSFLGNKGLCGEPLKSVCDISDQHNPYDLRHRVSYRIVLAVVGSGAAVFASVTIVVALFMMRERQENAAKAAGTIVKDEANNPPTIVAGDIFVENLKQAVDLNSAVQATLKDSNMISTGTFSMVYKAVMPSGLLLLVKRLKSMDRSIVHHQSKMIRELDRLSRLSHDNLMTPIGYVIYDDVALILHCYLPNGTLAQLLHVTSKESEYEPDWPRRLSAVIGVAEGLAFLHHLAVIHLDICSGNVFLDSNFSAVVGEIEISKLLDPSRGTASISAVAGSFGYIPPEYAYTMQVTAPGNVYSVGVILLEILTTRTPVDEVFGEGTDLVKWVHSAPMRGETPEQILDAKLSTVSFTWRKEMLAVLKVALLCTDNIPAKRPKMKRVVELLQEIKQN